MSFPTLANLTKNKIIEYAVNGSLPPTVCLDPVTSNTVIQQLLPLLEILDQNTLEVISKVFKPTSINLTGIDMTEKIFEVIRSFNLTSLSLGYFEQLENFEKDRKYHSLSKKYPPVAATRRSMRRDWSVDENEKGICEVYDLPAVLQKILNEESRASLTDLDLSPEATGARNQGHTEQFADGWAKEIGRMLPSLKNLSLRHRITTFNDFQGICSFFPNLESLDLSYTAIESLTGISQLTKLKTLKIGGLQIEKSRCLVDIFNIENLENLSFAQSSVCGDSDGTIEKHLRSRRPFPKLRHLDLSYSYVKEEIIRKFVEAHPTLESLSICDSDPIEIPGIRVFHSETLQAATESLKFYADENNALMVGAMMWSIRVNLNGLDRPPVDDLRECFKQVVSAMDSFCFLKAVMNSGAESCKELLKIAPLSTYNQEDIVRMVSIMIRHISLKVKAIDSHFLANKATEPQWDLLNNRELLLNTSHIELNQICRLNIAMFEKTSDRRGYMTSSCHITIFDIIKDRINPNLEIFQSVQKTILVNHIEEFNGDQWFTLPEEIDAAQRLIRFVNTHF
ncbi:hypothetical protein B9Z55_007556 [Caenorhabditis nigoni]|uniref:Uncharacterized protein n=1 Tax=Caenorhabditis nigoni TaxID=1611254 RepID=A0A2G5VA68_9PELO|nr:hypothetical protein B9Z55_007556 [Caenorhabditis nigoni]